MVVSKNRITAGNGLKAHNMEEKAAISTQTTCDIFTILKEAGMKIKKVFLLASFAYFRDNSDNRVIFSRFKE